MASSKMRRLGMQFGAAVLALGLAGCTGTPGPAPSSSAGSSPAVVPTATFNFGTASMPLGLDPAMTADSESYRVTRQVLEGLVGVDATTGQTTPLLATEWKDSNNGLSYDFTLRSGVTFHDGTALRCRRRMHQLQPLVHLPRGPPEAGTRQLVPRASSRPTPTKPVFSIFKDCKAVSASDVRINLTRPFTGFLQALTLPAFAISSPPALDAEKADVLDQSTQRPGQCPPMPPPGGHRPLRLHRPGTRRSSPWPATRTTGATGARSPPSTSSPTTTRKHG